jgi:hypothetical protein
MKDVKYITSDLYLCAFLKASGQRMTVSKNKNKVSFIFDETPEIILLVNSYLTDSALCNPLTYSNSIKNIKNLLYNL